MKYLALLSLLAFCGIYGCGDKGEKYPLVYNIVADYTSAVYDTGTAPIEEFDTIPAAMGVVTKYSIDSIGLTVDDWTGMHIIDWKGKIEANGYYYKQVDDYRDGTVYHNHYNIFLIDGTMFYNYHTRIGEGTRHDVGGNIVRETVVRYSGTISK